MYMKILKKLFKLSIFFLVFIIFIYAGIYLYAKLSPKLPIENANSLYFYDIDNQLYPVSGDDSVNLDEISEHLINATISIEDKNFYKHAGFDYLRIFKAFYINTVNQEKLQGASTISQQYIKNLFLDFGKTWKRKIEEAWLTIRLEAHYDKDEILAGYLNTINYGGIFGIENAAKYYFDKNAKDLTLAEATILAGIPKSPVNYSPISNEENAKKRQEIILTAMVKNKYITENDKEKAMAEDLSYNQDKPNTNLTTLMYYKDAVIEELRNISSIPNSLLTTGGLRIYTNLDLKAQTIMDESINKNMPNDDPLQIASVVMDPNNGKILALAGGVDYSKSQFNRAISSKRQVGSTIKPILYYAALENGFTAGTTFISEKTTFTFAENKTYSPQNFGNTYANKPISMAAALTYSDNIYAVKTHIFLGEEVLVDTAKRVGIKTDLSPVPSLALGAQEINIIEMIQAYSAFANEGYKITPHLINKIEDMNGNILYSYKPIKENILNRNIVFILNELLSNCSAPEFIDYNYPTCINMAPKLSKKYAIKTGSTDTDHVILGYNKDLIVGIWTGYDDNTPTPNSNGLFSKEIWIDIMEKYLEDKNNDWYKMPSNVVGVLSNAISGEIANNNSKNKKILYYIKGTEPYEEVTDLDDLIPTVKEQ